MIYPPNTSIKTWLRRYPALNECLPATCLCEREVTVWRPWLTKDYAGLEAAIPCECGRGPTNIYIPISKEKIAKWKALFGDFLV